MRRVRRLALALVLLAAVGAAGEGSASDAGSYVPREYIVTLAGADAVQVLHALYAEYGIERLQPLGEGRFLLRLARDPGIETLRAAAEASGRRVELARNFIYRYQR
ncbi:MAG TPA: hypothetical protein VF203_03430 [Burkholderiales bacterium]